jgi:hypothetical protein
MATMYAIPALSTWDNATPGGWSNTSGGVNNGLSPASSDDVIFDANSGAARGITCSGAMCNNISVVAGCTGIALSGDINPYGSNIYLAPLSSVTTIQIQSNTTYNLIPPTGTITNLYGNGATRTLFLFGDLRISKFTSFSSNFNANGYNVTANTFSGTGGTTLTLGSGTFTLTGTGNVWNYGGATVVPGTSTIKITDKSASAKTFIGGSKTYNNIWNDTTGSGGLSIDDNNNTFNNFKISPGCIQIFANSTTHTINSLTADGTGNPITIQTQTPGTPTTLTKSGGGSIYMDYYSIKDIAATPANTWNARNSTNVSGNSGINFIPGNSKFLAFL